jgi:ribosomal protein S18 acetylase RimI-like enzyme
VNLNIRQVYDVDRAWVLEVLAREWAGPLIERTDEYIEADKLPAVIAEVEDERVGLATVLIHPDHFEIVTLNSFREKQGIGTALIRAVEDIAVRAGKPEVRIFTYNGNLNALGFYQKRGYRLWAVHRDTITRARDGKKPDIPLLDENGIVIADEIELRRRLD